MVDFKLETLADAVLRERLLHAAFGQGRFRKTAEKLRRGFMPAEGLAFTTLDEAGHRRNEGLGAMMMRRGLAQAQWLGHKAVILVGDEPYYRRFGFGAEAVARLTLPGPVERARFLGLALEPGALHGAEGLVTACGRKLTTAARAASA